MRVRGLIGAAIAVVTLGLSAVTAPAAFATAQTGSAAGMTFDLGPLPLPATCPFANGDANFAFQDGNTVSHGTFNKNGGWGGETAEGTATFLEDSTALYTGHLTIWGGGGNNAKLQTEGGLTVNFTGTGADGSTLTLHLNLQQTTNASGTPTANVLNASVICG